MRRRSRERGALLGIVLILLVVVMITGTLAIWGVRSDTSAAGNDRLGRQLFACAEQGLEFGKQFFSGAGLDWQSFLNSNSLCPSTGTNLLPCYPNGPIRNGTQAPPSAFPGYPYGPPFTQTTTMGGQPSISVNGTSYAKTAPSQSLTWTVAIYNPIAPTGLYSEYFQQGTSIVVYSQCFDPLTGQSKAAQAILRSTVPSNIDYAGQAGFGFRNLGNQN